MSFFHDQVDGREEVASASSKEASQFGGKQYIVHSLRCDLPPCTGLMSPI